MLRRFQCGRLFRHPLPQTTLLTLLALPNELLLIIAAHAATLHDLNSLLRTNRHLYSLLTPSLLRRAIASTPKNNRFKTNRRSDLHWAAAHERPRLVRSLLMNGAEAHVNDRDCYGVTPLYSAAHREAVVVVELLLAHGADPAVHVYGNIRELVEGGHDEVCRQIRERRKGLDVVAQWSWWLKRFVVVQEYDRCLWCNRGYSEEEKEVAMV